MYLTCRQISIKSRYSVPNLNVHRLFVDVRYRLKILILLSAGCGRKMSLSKTFRVKAFACSSYILEVNLQACMAAQS